VIRVTPSHDELWFNSESDGPPKKNGGEFGDASMSQDLDSSGLYDASIVDDRNERPLTIAFATIVTMWLLAFGLVFVSAHIDAQSKHRAESAASIVK
jgi:hypothetical protein